VRRELDFIVIGTQKGGTTSLWEYLRRHPSIAMPPYKEVPLFCAPQDLLSRRVEEFMQGSFDGLPPGTVCGKVSTHYMMGLGSTDVEQIAERIHGTFPEVRLIALLRDPIDRAVSHYRMSVRRGIESRSFDDAVEELLEPDQLEAGRGRPSETNSYLAQGEYGRVFQHYWTRFSPEQIHVATTDDLERHPEETIDRVLSFVGLAPGYRPENLGERHHVGGMRPRLDADGLAQLHRFMDENVWPKLGAEEEQARLSFDFFLQTWNVIPDDQQPDLSDSNRGRLEAHYRADAELLAAIGIEAPWLDAWDGRSA
jgi:hypothetical protein